MQYIGYIIEPEKTGYGQVVGHNFDFYIPDNDGAIEGWGMSVEDCKRQIDEILDEN